MNLEEHLHSTDLIDCAGRISHRLTVLVDGRVRVRSGEVEAIVDPATGDVSPPWCRLGRGEYGHDQVVAVARSLTPGR